MEDSNSSEGFGNWFSRSDDFAGSQNQGRMDVQLMLAEGGPRTGADVTRGAAFAAPQTDQSREQSQHALIVQASRAMRDFQQLQWECEADKCGFSPPIFEDIVRSCCALPVSDRLDLLNEHLEFLRQRKANHASRQVVHQVHQRPAPSVTNDDSRSLQHAAPPIPPSTPQICPNYADDPTSAPSVTPAANAAPSVVFTGRKRTLDRLLRLATRAYNCIVEQIREHGPEARVGREEIFAMLGGEDGVQVHSIQIEGEFKSRQFCHAAESHAAESH